MYNLWTNQDLDKVRVTDSYYDEAFRIELDNMLLLDADRLLAGFRETAGFIAGMDKESRNKFMKGKRRYGGQWEDGMIGGHTLGHYLAALSQAVLNLSLSEDKKEKVRERLDCIVSALKECQNMTTGTKFDGYIFGATLPTKEFEDNPVLQFDNVEKGLSDFFTQSWVPWYTMHKILSGLNAGFRLAGNETSLDVANRLGLWIAKRTESWTGEVRNTVLSIEYGGMNDCLYELYQINRELEKNGNEIFCKDYERFKSAAHSFDEEELFERVYLGQANALNNIHANTTIPKFIGALSRYEADNSETKYLEYAESFWDMVISKHTYVTGGNSEDEHFGEDGILDAERTNVNNETCNTYNMLKFSRRLFAATGKKKYLDYAERTLINAIMASQNHESGFTTYFQPMATGYQKVFSSLEGNFWCCTGTGYENFTRLQDGIYFENNDKNALAIAFYLSSELVTDEYTVVIDCDFKVSDEVKIKISPKKGHKFSKDLWLIIPSWLDGKAIVKIGGTETAHGEKNGFLLIPKRSIESGAELSLMLPMGITCHNLSDGKDTYAFMYGPYVLSARLGSTKMKIKAHGIGVNVAAEKEVCSDELLIKSGESVEEFIANIDRHLIRRSGTMEFDLTGTDRELVFTTHYNQYTESYGIYWKLRS